MCSLHLAECTLADRDKKGRWQLGLRFYIQDHDHTDEPEALCQLFQKQLGMQSVGVDAQCDILVVHRNSDAPGRRYGIDERKVHDVTGAGGLYIEYTTGSASFECTTESHIYGPHAELVRRLRRLKSATTVEDVRYVLNESVDDYEYTRSVNSALAILCQGFLSTWARKDGAPDLSPDDSAFEICAEALDKMGWVALCGSGGSVSRLVADDLCEYRTKVSQLSWWAEVFEHGRPRSDALRESGVEEGSKIERLLGAIWPSSANLDGASSHSEGIAVDVVAGAYLELVRLLEDGE